MEKSEIKWHDEQKQIFWDALIILTKDKTNFIFQEKINISNYLEVIGTNAELYSFDNFVTLKKFFW